MTEPNINHLTPTEQLNTLLKMCYEQMRSPQTPERVKSDVKDCVKEVLVNRATIGDEQTAQWLDTSIRYNQLMFSMRKRGL